MFNPKSSSVIDKDTLPGNIHIYGVGATGSALAVKLARLNLADKMRVYDFDEVEEKNLNNQAFLYEHIGTPKVEALKDLINKIDPGNDMKTFNRKVKNGRSAPGDIAFICLDNYSGRADILETPSRWKGLNITGGISSIGGNVNVIKGKDVCLEFVEEYRNSSDEPEYNEEDLTPCGSPISIYHRVDFASSVMIELMMTFLKSDQESINKNIMFDIPNMIIIND